MSFRVGETREAGGARREIRCKGRSAVQSPGISRPLRGSKGQEGSEALTLSAADLTGTWTAAVTLVAGSGNATFVFKQAGEKLTGTYSGQVGQADVTGTVKGSDAEWSFEAGEAGKVSYKGTIGADGKISGTVQYGQLGSGKFTAEKQK